MPSVLYLDTFAILRAVMETGTSPEVEAKISLSPVLVISRLAIVEASRALLRLGQQGTIPEVKLADAARALDALWARCEIWELTASVCDLAATVSPPRALRTLDALHLATYLLARRRLGEVELLTSDERLRAAVEGV